MNELFLVKGLCIGFGTIWFGTICYAIGFWWKHRKDGDFSDIPENKDYRKE